MPHVVAGMQRAAVFRNLLRCLYFDDFVRASAVVDRRVVLAVEPLAVALRGARFDSLLHFGS